jgi:hypothetical protein
MEGLFVRTWTYFSVLFITAAMMATPLTASAYGFSTDATCKFHVIPSANPFADQNFLNSVYATSASDAWAVGNAVDTSTGNQFSLAEHWNGHAWSLSTTQTPGGLSAFFNGVAAISPSDVWAVGGYYDSTSGHFLTLAEHWNGTSWSVIPTPNPGPLTNNLLAIAANSTSDVWAVGVYKLAPGPSGAHATLVEHWNGSAWSVVPSPNVGSSDSVLDTVMAHGANDVWATGSYNCKTGICRSLSEHWNGTKWAIVPSPNSGTSSNALNGAASAAKNDVWMLGDFFNGTTFRTLTEHWNGTKWSIIRSANMGPNQTDLTGGAAVNSNDVWAVGQWLSGSFYKPYAMQWNGRTWTSVAVPTVGSFSTFFAGASKIPGTTNLWAVGTSSNSDGTPHLTLIEQFHC